MSGVTLTDDSARARLARAVEDAERLTSAEIVVALRVRAGRSFPALAAGGAIASSIMVAVLMVHPWPFSPLWFVVDPLLAFVVGAALVAEIPALERLLTPAAARRARAEAAARVAFETLGVSGTRRRHGVLVYVALAERELVVVPDVGVDATTLERGACPAVDALHTAVARHALEPLAEALVELGRALAPGHPADARTGDELPNEVR